jgi:hypothetical protein
MAYHKDGQIQGRAQVTNGKSTAMTSCLCTCPDVPIELHCIAPRLYVEVNSIHNHAPRAATELATSRSASNRYKVGNWHHHFRQYQIIVTTKYQRIRISNRVVLCSVPCTPLWVLSIIGVGAPRSAWMPASTWSVCMPAPEDGLEDGAPLTPASLCRAPIQRATCQPTMYATADVITPVTSAYTAHSDFIDLMILDGSRPHKLAMLMRCIVSGAVLQCRPMAGRARAVATCMKNAHDPGTHGLVSAWEQGAPPGEGGQRAAEANSDR